MKYHITILIIVVILFCVCSCNKNEYVASSTPTTTVQTTKSIDSDMESRHSDAYNATAIPTPHLNDPTIFATNRARLFTAALATDNVKLATEMLSFPLRISLKDETREITTVYQLMSIYRTVFDAGFVKAFGTGNLGDNVITGDDGEVIIQKGDYKIFVNPSGMVFEVQNNTMTFPAVEAHATPEVEISFNTSDCYSAAKNQPEMRICASQELKLMESTLEEVIEEMKPGINEYQSDLNYFGYEINQLEDFFKVQTEWESIVKTQCRWEESIHNYESNQTYRYNQCLIKKYKQWINELRLLLCPSDGMTGECEASWYFKQDL